MHLLVSGQFNPAWKGQPYARPWPGHSLGEGQEKDEGSNGAVAQAGDVGGQTIAGRAWTEGWGCWPGNGLPRGEEEEDA